jgi:hypothetical protein
MIEKVPEPMITTPSERTTVQIGFILISRRNSEPIRSVSE